MISFVHRMLYGLLFGLISATAAVIAIAATQGIPKTFDREMHWTCFAASGIGSVILILSAQRMARSAASWGLIPTLLAHMGLFLIGISIGCGVGTFVFKKRPEPEVLADSAEPNGGAEC